MITAENIDRLVGMTAAVGITGYSQSWILKLANDGRLPCIKTEIGRLFDRNDLERLRNPRDARTTVEAH